MNVRQSLSVLFFPKKQNADSHGNAPIYVRITIDGLRDEFSTGLTVPAWEWNVETKTVSPSTLGHKTINKQLGQIKADVERHFDLVQAKDGLATLEAVTRSYQTPINGHVKTDRALIVSLHQYFLQSFQRNSRHLWRNF